MNNKPRLNETVDTEHKSIIKRAAKVNAIKATLHFIVLYGIALSIWGLALKKNFLWFGLFGVIVGLLISLAFVVPVIVKQMTLRTEGDPRDTMFGAGVIWGGWAIIIGVLGIVVWIIRAIFFR